MNVLDLFSGIGGFSLGLERAGMRTVAFCEVNPFCQAILHQHWPGVPIFGDIRELTASALAARSSTRRIDVICGGFPCQDISIAGNGAGIEGERSGLWSEFYRLIRELRPRYVIVENVAEMLNRGMGRVVGDLASLWYDAEWHCIPAAYVGARHIRDRIWIIANSSGNRLERSIHFADSLAAMLPYDWRSIAGTTFSADPESWASEPAFLGADDDVPNWMDRVAACGTGMASRDREGSPAVNRPRPSQPGGSPAQIGRISHEAFRRRSRLS